MAAPTKLSNEVVNKLEEVFSLDGTIEEACLYAGISRQTYYNWIKENSELIDRFNLLRKTPILKARRTVVSALTDPEFALKYLERKLKAEFSPRHEITGAEGGPVQIIAPDNI
jgi:hypothetical protein